MSIKTTLVSLGLILLCAAVIHESYGQEPDIKTSKEAEKKLDKKLKKAETKKTGSETKKEDLEAAKKALEQEVDKKLKESNAKLDAKVETEKKNISGYLTQFKSPRSMMRSKALYAIFGAYKEGKISKRTAILVFLDAGKDNFPVVSTTAYTKLRDVTGEKTGNNLDEWKKWWEKQEKKREEDLKKEIEKKLGASTDVKAETGDEKEPEEAEEETPAEKKERLREEGKTKLVREHNDSLGYLDRIFLKNGRELTGYIIREDKNEKGEIIRYVVKFKGALGQMVVPASEVEGKPQYDINKGKQIIMPLPVSAVEKP